MGEQDLSFTKITGAVEGARDIVFWDSAERSKETIPEETFRTRLQTFKAIGDIPTYFLEAAQALGINIYEIVRRNKDN